MAIYQNHSQDFFLTSAKVDAGKLSPAKVIPNDRFEQLALLYQIGVCYNLVLFALLLASFVLGLPAEEIMADGAFTKASIFLAFLPGLLISLRNLGFHTEQVDLSEAQVQTKPSKSIYLFTSTLAINVGIVAFIANIDSALKLGLFVFSIMVLFFSGRRYRLHTS